MHDKTTQNRLWARVPEPDFFASYDSTPGFIAELGDANKLDLAHFLHSPGCVHLMAEMTAAAL